MVSPTSQKFPDRTVWRHMRPIIALDIRHTPMFTYGFSISSLYSTIFYTSTKMKLDDNKKL